MEKQTVNVFGKLLLIAMVFGVLTPLIANARQDTEARL